MVLLQVDPTQAIGVADKLGTATTQQVLGLLCVALAISGGWAIWRLISEIKSCGLERAEWLGKTLDAQNRSVTAYEKNTEVMERALDALGKGQR